MYFFDSYALIEILKGSSNYARLKQHPLVTGAINIAETHSIFIQDIPDSKVRMMIESLNSKILEANQEIAMAASSFRHHNKKLKLSYADCLGYCTALASGLIFVTGDDAFNGLDNVEFIK